MEPAVGELRAHIGRLGHVLRADPLTALRRWCLLLNSRQNDGGLKLVPALVTALRPGNEQGGQYAPTVWEPRSPPCSPTERVQLLRRAHRCTARRVPPAHQGFAAVS